MLRIENVAQMKKHIERLVENVENDSVISGSMLTHLNKGVCLEESFIKGIVEERPELNEDIAIQMLLGMIMFDENKHELIQKYLIGRVKKIDKNIFHENPYVKNIHFNDSEHIEKDDIVLKIENLEKYQIQVVDCQSKDKNLSTKISLGYFDEEVSVPVLYQNDEAWMSITPSEINTMGHHIFVMNGHVVVFGLGLGYFAYMCSLKENVKSVTVVEINTDIIEVFEEKILPQFEFKDKINIVKGDAYELYADKTFMKNFDSCFIDIWKDCRDAVEAYSYFKENEYIHKVKTRYWLEEEISVHMQDILVAYILGIYINDKSPINKALVPEYISFLYDKIENYFNGKKHVLKSKDDLYRLLNDKKIASDIFKKPLPRKIALMS